MALDRIASFRALIAKAPQDPFPRYGLAMEFRSRGELETAATSFDELIAAFPDYVPSYLMAGGVAAKLGRADRAIELYTRGIEVATARGDTHARGELQSALAEASAMAEAS
ncbi:MAG: tetratricopeptide repeat protein [Myxococcales bacterium]|nr:tetratricopeptide repeat protein [Myxococcales bacterium]